MSIPPLNHGIGCAAKSEYDLNKANWYDQAIDNMQQRNLMMNAAKTSLQDIKCEKGLAFDERSKKQWH